MCLVCCDNGREEKKAKYIVFSFFLSLSLSPTPFSFVFLSFNAFSLLLYARNREDILIERVSIKRKKTRYLYPTKTQ